MLKYDGSMTEVLRRYDEPIAMCLNLCKSGLVRSGDGMMNVCNYLTDYFLVYSGIAHDLDKAPG